MKQIFLVILILISFCNTASANKLQQIQTQIQNLKTLLSKDQNQQSDLQHQLKNTEIDSGNLAVQLQKTQQSLAQQQFQLHSLSKLQGQYQNQLQSQKATLAQQLRTIYILGQQQYLKLLLNQEDPARVSRTLIYYHYIDQRRVAMIQQFNQTLANVTQNAHSIERHSQQLQLLQNQQQHERKQLAVVKQQREQLLQTLNSKMANSNQQLAVLTANKLALEKVVTHLAKTSHYNVKQPAFTQHLGKLSWPTRGKVIQPFGIPIQQSQLKSSGVLIAAPEGQNVYAIAPGEIVFANWMAGYGLLIIVDHGNGFMSIYGRNHALYKKVGEKVKVGDLIATVGDTGGYTQAALYFALRRDGKPVDPEQWCA